VGSPLATPCVKVQRISDGGDRLATATPAPAAARPKSAVRRFTLMVKTYAPHTTPLERPPSSPSMTKSRRLYEKKKKKTALPEKAAPFF